MRRPVGNTSPGISLFPFLAVLLCTMGALIVVLVVLNRQSRLQAAAARSDRDAVSDEVQTQRREDLAWRIEQLQSSRQKTAVDLANERQRLAVVEDNIRRLDRRAAELQVLSAQLEVDPSTAADNAAAELDSVTRKIELAAGQLAAAREAAATAQPKYAVVAYEGPNRTQRRPIYIECRADRVIIQPEGIELAASDFNGPPGPGNPLPSAIRAAADHFKSQAADPTAPETEPYPLFLVRPDGIEAYYAARATMQSWGSDFGYQTIDSEWDLEFPPSDPRLAELERRAVAEARERMAWLVEANPRRYRDGPRESYRVSPLGGGLVREGGPRLNNSPRSTGFGASADARSGRPVGSGRFAASGSGTPNAGIGGGAPGRASDVFNKDGSLASSGGPNRTYGGAASSPDAGTNPAGGTASGGKSDRPPSLSDGSQRPAQSPTDPTQTAGAGGAESERQEPRYGDLNDRRRTDDPAKGSLEVSGSASSDAATGESQIEVSAQKSDRKPSLAATRGKNWGLGASARSSIPVTRPIQILCEGDRLVLAGERRGDPAHSVPLPYRTEDGVDPLVDHIQQRIKTWGLAGRGMYWRPELVLEVGPSGEGRFADLEALLADSGFDVRRKESRTAKR